MSYRAVREWRMECDLCGSLRREMPRFSRRTGGGVDLMPVAIPDEGEETPDHLHICLSCCASIAAVRIHDPLTDGEEGVHRTTTDACRDALGRAATLMEGRDAEG